MSKKKSKITTKIDSPSGTFLPLLQGAAAALLVATVLFSGESLVRYGNGHLLTVLWFLLAAVCAGWNFWNKKNVKNSLLENLPLILFFLCIIISTAAHLFPGQGCVRYGLNAFFVWIGFAAAFYVFRTVLDSPDTQKKFLAILVSLAFTEAVL